MKTTPMLLLFITRALNCSSAIPVMTTELTFGQLDLFWLEWYSFSLIKIFNKTPFLHGTDNIDQILKITRLVGTREVVKYIKDNKLTEKKGHKK